jgi:transposase
VGEQAREVIERQGYIAHIRGRGQEKVELERKPNKKARRWVVEVAHSWFNRFRKLLVRYEKLHRSLIALNQLAAAIIVFRKIPLKINIIYG